jgi:cell filamentation protein
LATDPYVYPGTRCPRNRLGIRDPAVLERVEAEQTSILIAQIEQARLPGRHDLDHLRAFHRRIFGDIYDWTARCAPSRSRRTTACSRYLSTSTRI